MKRIAWITPFVCLLAVTPALAIPTQTPPQTVPPTDIATGSAEPSETSAVVLGYFNYGNTSPPGIAKDCWFEYGTTLAYGAKEVAICSGTTKATLSPLLPGTTYHYRAAASNEAGTSYGPDKTFATRGSPPNGGPPPPGSSPNAAVDVVAGQSLGSVLRKGLRLRVTIPGPCPCVVRTRLLVSSSTARRLGLASSKAIAASRGEYGAAGTVKVRMRLKSSLKARLRDVRTLKATARVAVTGSTGQPAVVSRTLRLKRAK